MSCRPFSTHGEIVLSIWPRRGSNPHEGYPSGDFKSPASAIPPLGPVKACDCMRLHAGCRPPLARTHKTQEGRGETTVREPTNRRAPRRRLTRRSTEKAQRPCHRCRSRSRCVGASGPWANLRCWPSHASGGTSPGRAALRASAIRAALGGRWACGSSDLFRAA